MTRSRLSIKARLIMRIEDKLNDNNLSAADRWSWNNMLKELRNRGSGPLPFHYRELARGWEIE